MAESIRYIESTTKKFYQGKFPEKVPGGPVEIPLRGKYRTGGMSPNWNRHSDNNGKAKQPGPKRGLHDLPKKIMFMSDAYSGHVVMITEDQFFAVTGYHTGFE
jgi:hypothetical protein